MLFLSSIQTYFLSLYILSSWVCKQFDKIRCNFLWLGFDSTADLPCKVRWKKACMAKEEGCLGIEDLKIFDRSCLVKWGWRYVDSGNWRRILSSFYFKKYKFYPWWSPGKSCFISWKDVAAASLPPLLACFMLKMSSILLSVFDFRFKII